MIPTNAIIIRHTDCSDADARLLTRLAALDSAQPLQSPALLAEVDGVARAAISLADGRVVADPFAPTKDLVELLSLRAQRLSGARPARTTLRRVLGEALRRPRAALTARA